MDQSKVTSKVFILDSSEIADAQTVGKHGLKKLDSQRIAKMVGYQTKRTPADDDYGDGIKLGTIWLCEKWSEDALDFARKKLNLPSKEDISSAVLRSLGITDEVHVCPGNALLDEGVTELADLIADTEGGTPVLWDNTNARLGVGSDATAFSATHTDLQDGTPTWKAMNGSYPQRTAQTIDWQSDFLTGEANEVWAEWGISNTASGAGEMINRKVQALGTKVSGTWTLTGSISFS